MIHTVFPIMVFFEVAIESSPEGHLNPRPLNSVQMLLLTELSGHELNWDLDQLCTATPSHSLLSVQFRFRYWRRQLPYSF